MASKVSGFNMAFQSLNKSDLEEDVFASTCTTDSDMANELLRLRTFDVFSSSSSVNFNSASAVSALFRSSLNNQNQKDAFGTSDSVLFNTETNPLFNSLADGSTFNSKTWAMESSGVPSLTFDMREVLSSFGIAGGNSRNTPANPSPPKRSFQALFESQLPPKSVAVQPLVAGINKPDHTKVSPPADESISAAVTSRSQISMTAVTSPFPQYDGSSNIATVSRSQGDKSPAKAHPTETKKRRKRIYKRPNYDPQVKQYVEPNDNDVLLGRGGRTNHHPGNHRYLIEKDNLQEKYLNSSKEQKTDVSQELVDKVIAWGGRFLKKDETDRWFVVANIAARKKASQALREVKSEDGEST